MLTSLANLKAYLGLTVITDDTLLTNLIERESARIEQLLSRTLASASYTLSVNGTGKDVQMVPNYPITAVASLSIDGAAIPASTGFTVAGYVFDDTAIYLRGGYLFTKGVKNVDIAYTAGYSTIPVDIEQSCIELAAWAYKNRERLGLSSKGLAGETTAYVTAAMPKHIEARLNPYKRVAQL